MIRRLHNIKKESCTQCGQGNGGTIKPMWLFRTLALGWLCVRCVHRFYPYWKED